MSWGVACSFFVAAPGSGRSVAAVASWEYDIDTNAHLNNTKYVECMFQRRELSCLNYRECSWK